MNHQEMFKGKILTHTNKSEGLPLFCLAGSEAVREQHPDQSWQQRPTKPVELGQQEC